MTKSQEFTVKFYTSRYSGKTITIEMIGRKVCMKIGTGYFARMIFIGVKGKVENV